MQLDESLDQRSAEKELLSDVSNCDVISGFPSDHNAIKFQLTRKLYRKRGTGLSCTTVTFVKIEPSPKVVPSSEAGNLNFVYLYIDVLSG
uniref:Uncharacterized protein n=1 Tax=Romanomermis culicivorax TaxID=13658 RepID=A0A915IXD8_ROMCU